MSPGLQLLQNLADVLPPASPLTPLTTLTAPADVPPPAAGTWGPVLFVALVLVAAVAVGAVVMRLRRGRPDGGTGTTPENRLSDGEDETYG